jgi:hypothetical protein
MMPFSAVLFRLFQYCLEVLLSFSRRRLQGKLKAVHVGGIFLLSHSIRTVLTSAAAATLLAGALTTTAPAQASTTTVTAWPGKAQTDICLATVDGVLGKDADGKMNKYMTLSFGNVCTNPSTGKTYAVEGGSLSIPAKNITEFDLTSTRFASYGFEPDTSTPSPIAYHFTTTTVVEPTGAVAAHTVVDFKNRINTYDITCGSSEYVTTNVAPNGDVIVDCTPQDFRERGLTFAQARRGVAMKTSSIERQPQ